MARAMPTGSSSSPIRRLCLTTCIVSWWQGLPATIRRFLEMIIRGHLRKTAALLVAGFIATAPVARQSLERLAQGYRKNSTPVTRAPLARLALAHSNDTEGAEAL